MRNGQPVAVLLDFDDYRGLVAAQALGRDSERSTEVRNIASRFSEGHLEGFREVSDSASVTGDAPNEILTSDAIAAGRKAYARARRHTGIEMGPHQRRATDVPARQPEKTRAGDT